MVDVQDIPFSWETARTPQNLTKHSNYLMQFELIFLLLLLQPRFKLRKTLIPTWRMRIQGCHVDFQGLHNILDLLGWDQEELETNS